MWESLGEAITIDRGWVVCPVVKIPLGVPTYHVGVPGFESRIYSHSIFLLIQTMGGSRWWLKSMGSYHPQGRRGLSS